MMRVGFEPTPFRTRSLVWRLRPLGHLTMYKRLTNKYMMSAQIHHPTRSRHLKRKRTYAHRTAHACRRLFSPSTPSFSSPFSSSVRTRGNITGTTHITSLRTHIMAYPPKTPTRHRSRSETKTPLSSSIFGTNHLADASNQFIVPSRTTSPVKSTTRGSYQVSEALQRQASTGVIRKGGIESRLDVVTRDYVPPPKSEKRSRSQPTVSVAH